MKNRKIIQRNLYYYSLFLGIKSLLKIGYSKEAIKRIVCPMDPSRYYELSAAYYYLSKYCGDGNTVLDISSPKLLTYFVASKNKNCKFISVDIQKKEIENWKKSFDTPNNINLLVEDARKLSFKSDSFDVIYSISTIEHVLDKGGNNWGDTLMMKEIRRVLKKNGILILTTMVANKFKILNKSRDIYGTLKKEKSKNLFFARVYDKEYLEKKIIKPSKLKVLYFETCQYKCPFLEQIFNLFVPVSSFVGFLGILIYPHLLNIRKGFNNGFGKRADALLIFKK